VRSNSATSSTIRQSGRAKREQTLAWPLELQTPDVAHHIRSLPLMTLHDAFTAGDACAASVTVAV
jgi:hypothetical protein